MRCARRTTSCGASGRSGSDLEHVILSREDGEGSRSPYSEILRFAQDDARKMERHSSMAVVETRKLTKIFKRGNVGAVVNVDLESREGEFLVLLGPSGSGKTTLLRMIAGLEEPTSGDILIGGRVVNDLTPRERGIAMVFQSYALYPHLSVEKNIGFPLRAHGVEKGKRRERIDWAAGLLGIQHLLHRKPRELSGG